MLHVTGWFDGCQLGSQFLYDGMRAHSPARLDPATAPYNHAPEADFDESVMPRGAELYATLAERALARG